MEDTAFKDISKHIPVDDVDADRGRRVLRGK
jgi:hypothetical protein